MTEKPRHPGDRGLAYPFQDRPVVGQVVEIRPGVLWLRMPMPFALDHINLWAIRDEDGWAVVDTGLRTEDVTNAWHALLRRDGPLQGEPITRVIATHMHPDHVGMAGWLTRRFECPLWMTRLEYLSCRVMMSDTGREAPEEGVDFYRRAGWSESDLDHYRTRFGAFGRMIHPLPDSFERLWDGQRLAIGGLNWEVVVGSGHSPEHACLLNEELGLLISGDQVLPKISSNTSVFPTEPHANPQRDWLDSLERIRLRVPDDVLVLPAHNDPFTGLHTRLSQLEESTLQSLSRLKAALSEPKRAIDVLSALFRREVVSDSMHFRLATGEAIAGLNYLISRGEATVRTAQDGVAWYEGQA
jgi:glyoxylase-like metal-dependent hydrolase (beta-lactamase superfamily II)